MAAETPVPAGYRYLRHLGAGGFGDVHLAEHVATGRWVAIKYIHPHLLTDPDVLARFRREAQVLAATDVASVVRVYDLDTTSEPANLVMEYVPGVTLWDLMEQAPLPAHQGLMALRDVAEALRLMAERGLVHRDIKPSNVFVLPTGRAKLGDFGLARAAAEDAGFRTVGAPGGTPAYFPPEVSCGDSEATVESDAYSFAIMVYEVLTGSRPITAPDAISLITAHWTQPPRPVTDALPGFPVAAAALLMRALAKQPAGRPLPHELMVALDAVPADQWPTNGRAAVPVPAAPQLERTSGKVADIPALAGAPRAVGGLSSGSGRPAETTIVAGSTPPIPTPPGSARPIAPVTVAALSAKGARGTPPIPAAARRRPRRPSPRRWHVAGAGAVALLASGLAAAWWLQDDVPEQRQVTRELAVTTLVVSADPASARCPGATVELVATVGTNGGPGSLSIAWTLPDGSRGPVQAFTVADGQREVVATLTVSLTGSRPVDGDAGAVVSPSGLRATTPLTYRCPARGRR